MSNTGFRPRNRSSKQPRRHQFEIEAHFITLRGGESYRCTICNGNPDFTSLANAVTHESTPEHILARRQLDRAPSPDVLPSLQGDKDDEYMEDLGSVAQGLHFDTHGGLGEPSHVPNDPSLDQTPASAGTEAADWHSSFSRWSEQPSAHFTVPGPALPSDPSDTVYDLFGTAAEDFSDKDSDLGPEDELPPDFFREMVYMLDDVNLGEPLSPPASVYGDDDELQFNPWRDMADETDIKISPFDLPESAEEWWPFSSRQEALFCLMTAFPRAVFSGKELDVVRWFSAKCNIPGMPTQSTVRSRFEHIMKLLGLESQLVQSELGNYFAVNSLASILKNEMANPIVRKELVFYPQDGGNTMSQAANGQRWTKEVDASLAAPMVRKELPLGGHQDFFVYEPLLASLPASEDDPTLVAQPLLPIRFFERSGELLAQAHPLACSDAGYAIDADTHIEVPVSSFLLSLPEFRLRHASYNLPAPDQILGVQSASHPGELHIWSKPIENPWRQKANGRLVRSVPLWLYCNDTSGNMSKKWNKHNSFLFTLTGLPRAHAQLPYNIHFLATSNIASPLEMLSEISEELRDARTNGIVAYDCVEKEDVVYIPWVYAMQGDNPMQSELCSHIGMTGKFFCRVCHVRGKDKERGDTEESETQRVTEFMKVHDPRTLADTLADLRVQEATAMRGTFSVIDDEARETGVKDKYLLAFIAILKEHQDCHKTNSKESSRELLQQLREQMPERLFNPALFIPDLDPNQDNPVEILHVILLGFAKYFWRDAVGRLNPEGKETLKARICSLDVTGLGLAALRGATLVQYAGSLTGRDFRAILQIGPLVLYGLLPDHVYEAWLALSRLGPLAFQQEIDDIDDYALRLTSAIDALLEATARWTPQWFNKPKFHVLLHLPQHIRRFGPAVLFATETFESYNFVIRLRSVHSNRHAPSHDISRAFSQLQSVRHLISGGWVTHTLDKSTKQVVRSEPRQAGPSILGLRHDTEFMSLMGMGSLSSEPRFGKYTRTSPIVEQPWASTVAAHCGSAAPSHFAGTNVTMCQMAVLRNNDVARCNGFVLLKRQDSLCPARVVEILATNRQAHGITAQIASLKDENNTYRMPGIELHEEHIYIDLQDVLCCLSVSHNCAQNDCILARTRVIRQEQQNTEKVGYEVEHKGDQRDMVVNVACLRSASLIQPLRAPAPQLGPLEEVALQA
ncbi:hypothetical protein FRC09_009442, partial [Ceratobasidium sp. 395]